MDDSSPNSDEPSPTGSADTTTGRRDVVVPIRLYKTITVFSTLIATACILGGFIFIDAATLQVSVLRRLLLSGLASIGLGVDQELFTGVLAIIGLSLMAAGTGVFVFSRRFRAPGMGNAPEDSDEK